MKLPQATLQTKVMGGLGLFFLFFVSVLFYTSWAFQRSADDQQILQRIGQLELTLSNVNQSSQRYLEVAPRDYESYFRDVAIFHKEVMSDIDILGQGIGRLDSDYAEFAAAGWLATSLGLGGRDPQLESSISQLQQQWTTFRAGLQEQLGDNENEPRLEWGAQFISNQAPALAEQLTLTQGEFNRVLEADVQRTKLLSNIAFVAAIVFAAIGVAWFYFGVVRRIRLTRDGCRRVAQGDFGYQLPTAANDELGELVQAFNSLSARARLVLAVLDRLHDEQTSEEAAQILWEETRDALGAQWFALANVDHREVSIHHAHPDDALQQIREPQNIGDKEQAFRDALNKKRPQYFPDLLRHSVANANARFIRDLHKSGYRSALFVPLIGETGHQCVMVLATQRPKAFNVEQITLLHRIGPMIAHQLERNVSDAASGSVNAA
ncbi:MAG: hypothetical protein Tsb002_01680 [Wenzhouxiangellaceae bacterium]